MAHAPMLGPPPHEEEETSKEDAVVLRSRGPDEANEVVEEEQEVYLIEGQRSSGPTEANEVLEEAEEDATNGDNNFCASCDSRYKANTFWISCDECGKWYHGKCVNITSSEAEHKEHKICYSRITDDNFSMHTFSM
ncbi:PHD finger protein ALFIN-LIKE 6-like [Miscanthus floridulus]|uniref:PHD finger protein ALFIN-LIKE 6-like n=1 Tax=Miscanthus floridulus TaxID=154761 RepID=UPI003458F04A